MATDKTDETDETVTRDETTAAELDRLREHNKQLLAELRAAKADLKAATEAAEAATGRATEWRGRYHQSAVLEPLEADMRGAAAGPWKYLRDTCTESKLLSMEPDADGVERAVWRTAKGEPADLARGLHRFLVEQCDAVPDLARALRAPTISGSGASGGFRIGPPVESQAAPAPAPTPTPAFGLR